MSQTNQPNLAGNGAAEPSLDVRSQLIQAYDQLMAPLCKVRALASLMSLASSSNGKLDDKGTAEGLCHILDETAGQMDECCELVSRAIDAIEEDGHE